MSTRTAPRTVEGTSEVVDHRGTRFAPAMSGVWAVLQGVVLSFVLVLLLAVVALLGAPDAGAAQVPWGAAGRVAAGLWLLGHGVPVGDLSVVPLGIGALALFTIYVSAKRSTIASQAAVVTGTCAYLAVVVGAAAATGTRGAGLALAAVGAVVVGGGGLVLGTLAQHEAPTVADVTERTFGSIPPVVRLGVRAGAVALAAFLGVSAVLVAIWAIAGRTVSDDVLAVLAPGWIGGVVLAVAQLALVPNLVLWASAWIAGPGFAVGAGTSFSTRGVVDGPLPALPLLGALPGPDWSGPLGSASPVVVVACGALGGWFAWRRLEPSLVRWLDVAGVLGGAAATAGLATVALQFWAGGSAGAGRLTVIGADPLVTGGIVAAEVLVGAALVVLPAYTRPWQHLTGHGRAVG
ncbi:PE-PGRS family protein [Xylanimonas cellulosilytica DSM 15894]|uniref:PE-PGRS family protein n=1 Tax=Xylanimonas cellulosilytica (strain DSM 15894 / JCM 12276 / CECT 5975 / KCTC 9989 / LMG 20990 / NBRC 107835 / XIL07) TaxID=446471 RepID=D1BXG5_XYLCX|nr:DUF6350 family protein [Xylanimonas cellulosilytica]ACZ29775.1 PE-PGRS family protein [Xylanimonas cellulosilytica DSM 15894]